MRCTLGLVGLVNSKGVKTKQKSGDAIPSHSRTKNWVRTKNYYQIGEFVYLIASKISPPPSVNLLHSYSIYLIYYQINRLGFVQLKF